MIVQSIADQLGPREDLSALFHRDMQRFYALRTQQSRELQQLGFSHRQGRVRIFVTGINILMQGHQILHDTQWKPPKKKQTCLFLPLGQNFDAPSSV